jgi:acetylornithine deacetylase/succinyl-diaminopimelate desuccinylase-like protein
MTYYQQHESEFLEGLKTFLRIPSISTFAENKPDIRRAAEFVLNELRAAGMTFAELIEGPGNPLVYGEWLGAPGKPTILFYGHYDVQPPDPVEEWKSPPFEPTIRGNDIFCRGASDDKGQTYIQIKAVEGLLKTTGRLPVNVKFLIEGEEETGGEHIGEYVKGKPPRLQADAAVICDTEMFAPELPTICVGLRGMVYCELHVEGESRPAFRSLRRVARTRIMAIAEILCALKDREGHIRFPASTTASCRLAKEREAWARLPSTSGSTRKRRWARRSWWGARGSLFERVWARLRSKCTAFAAALPAKAPRP